MCAGDERIQKYLASLGVASRRKVEQWIREGRLTVNGMVAQLGDRISPGIVIKVDGRLLPTTKRRNTLVKKVSKVILYNKPEGKICTHNDPSGRPTVFKDLPRLHGERWISVGRLDINTRGLLLFTTDGELASHLMHPRTQIEREYLCRVFGDVNSEKLNRLRQGIALDGDEMRFQKVGLASAKPTTGSKNKWFSVVITQGKYREVRRLWKAVGCEVNRLLRIRYGKISLPRGLKLSDWLPLTTQQVDTLKNNCPHSETVVPKLKKNKSAGNRRF